MFRGKSVPMSGPTARGRAASAPEAGAETKTAPARTRGRHDRPHAIAEPKQGASFFFRKQERKKGAKKLKFELGKCVRSERGGDPCDRRIGVVVENCFRSKIARLSTEQPFDARDRRWVQTSMQRPSRTRRARVSVVAILLHRQTLHESRH